jgi:hypothetical protein
MDDVVDIAGIFQRLAAEGKCERQTIIGWVDVRLVRVERGICGRWDRHDDTTDTVIVWSGNSTLRFENALFQSGPGNAAWFPWVVEHQGTSPNGADIILIKTALADF